MTIDPDTLAWLADALIQSSLLLAAGLTANLVLRRVSAAHRHRFLLITSLGVPLLLVLSAVLPTRNILPGSYLAEARPLAQEASQVIEFGTPVAAKGDPFESAAPPAPPLATTPSGPNQPATPVSTRVIMLWLVGVLVLWLRLVFGLLSLTRIRKSSFDPDSPVFEILEEESRSFGIRSSPKIVALPDQSMPMTWQFGAHVLALPEAAASWSTDKIRHVIRHELAHIKRRDCHTSWLSRLSLALVWFNPLALLLNRALDAAREAACDDLALEGLSGQQAHETYAQHLLDIITTHSKRSRKASLALAIARRTGELQRRLKAIMNLRQDRRSPSATSRHLVSVVSVLAICILASLSACRNGETSEVPEKPATANPQVKVSIKVVEFDSPEKLRKFFKVDQALLHTVGIISQETMALLMSEFQSDPGVGTLTSLSVVTPLGHAGRIEQTSEFVYPPDFPPEIPNHTAKVVGEGPESAFVVTPATPKNFEAKNLGITLQATPKRTEDFIELAFSLTHTDFLGFVNYGSPMTAPATDFFEPPAEITITPVFSSKRLQSTITLSPGQVIILAGLAAEPDPDLNKTRQTAKTGDYSNLRPDKHTLYFICPEFLILD